MYGTCYCIAKCGEEGNPHASLIGIPLNFQNAHEPLLQCNIHQCSWYSHNLHMQNNALVEGAYWVFWVLIYLLIYETLQVPDEDYWVML